MNKSNGIPRLTLEDKLNTIFFEPLRPALVLEGDSDVEIYQKMLTLSRLDWGKIDIVIADGKNQIVQYIDNDRIPNNFVAVVDADYDYYNNSLIKNTKIIYTHFYTVENYLVRRPVLQKLLDDFKRIGNESIQVDDIIMDIRAMTEPFAMACVAKLSNGWKIPLESQNIERFFDKNSQTISQSKLEEYIYDELEERDIENPKINWRDIADKYDNLLVEFDEDQLITGKIKLDALFKYFVNKFPEQMKGRRKSAFRNDLIANITYCDKVNELVRKIDNLFCSVSSQVH